MAQQIKVLTTKCEKLSSDPSQAHKWKSQARECTPAIPMLLRWEQGDSGSSLSAQLRASFRISERPLSQGNEAGNSRIRHQSPLSAPGCSDLETDMELMKWVKITCQSKQNQKSNSVKIHLKTTMEYKHQQMECDTNIDTDTDTHTHTHTHTHTVLLTANST